MQKLYKVTQGKKCGYVDARGVIVVSPIYDYADAFHEGMGAVCNVETGPNGKIERHGYVDATGRLVIDLVLPRIVKEFREGLAPVLVETGCWAFIDRLGNVVIEARYDAQYCAGFSEGVAGVCQVGTETWGYIDTRGDVVIPFELDWAGAFACGFALVKRGGKPMFIDKHGVKLTTVKCTPRLAFTEGLACVKSGKLYGFIGTDGQWHIEPRFSGAESFAEGLSAVTVDSKVGFIDTRGEFVIEPIYEDGRRFRRGVTAVKQNGRWRLINVRGETLFESPFDYIDMAGDSREDTDLLRADVGRRRVYIDYTGKQVSPLELTFDPEERTREIRALFEGEPASKQEQAWDQTKWHAMEGLIGVRTASRHIQFVLRWLDAKGLLTESGKGMCKAAPDLDYGLYRADVTPVAADFLDRCYMHWFDNESIVNFVLDSGIKFEGSEHLDEYWAIFQSSRNA